MMSSLVDSLARGKNSAHLKQTAATFKQLAAEAKSKAQDAHGRGFLRSASMLESQSQRNSDIARQLLELANSREEASA